MLNGGGIGMKNGGRGGGIANPGKGLLMIEPPDDDVTVVFVAVLVPVVDDEVAVAPAEAVAVVGGCPAGGKCSLALAAINWAKTC